LGEIGGFKSATRRERKIRIERGFGYADFRIRRAEFLFGGAHIGTTKKNGRG